MDTSDIGRRFFSWLATPVIHFFSGSLGAATRIIRSRPFDETPVTEKEIKSLIHQGTEAGTFEKAEQDMLQRVFRLSEIKANALMTPRTKMVWLDLEDTAAENLKIITESKHSRFPVAKGSLDNFVGVVYTKDLFAQSLEHRTIDLEKCVQTPLFIPKYAGALKILEMFKSAGAHDGIVLDEYGGVLGFITIYDIVTEIIGDLPFKDEQANPQMVKREDGSWLLDGLIAIDELKSIFCLDELPDEEEYNTLGGFITCYLGQIPATGEYFEWNGYKFEIVDMDHIRVDKVLITPLPANELNTEQ
ncbi:MAG TPA: hemolysin family protein [Methylomusa anaerophila]|uniref:Magnesium and cobalt efflux protein CorC n=1 Tax=Methylomusa anaerophila TaxID=1930071 RepID=A0A348AM27_9FIRM|nr:hemolysin family protein [Methylomusa anaerophila]BBB92125.1 magnesium and cobalt efflux protein CorC [Methylomusa anaerophila]HML87861.1 hemolysin family protein [Methylomusa anaerophila]